MKDKIFVFLQYCTPQHLISALAGKLASCQTVWLKNILIDKFIATFNVNMAEAKHENTDAFASFNDFFCRELKDGARTINTQNDSVVSPADGCISQSGSIDRDQIFQAKGHYFSTQALLACDNKTAAIFENGTFSTIYLSPRDYHRVHMPLDGKLISMTHVPGDLFSVNNTTANAVPNLFARNERVVCLFQGESGVFAMVLVGAMIVGSVDTVWHGQVAPIGKNPTQFDYTKETNITLKKGEEMGRFKLGSTVVLLFPEGDIKLDQLPAQKILEMGERIGSVGQSNKNEQP